MKREEKNQQTRRRILDSALDEFSKQRLTPGAYTLAESEAPEGYLKADPIDFTVAEVTDVQEVSMTDLRIPTPQELPSTGEGLPIGAVLAGISAGCAFMGYLLVRRS